MFTWIGKNLSKVFGGGFAIVLALFFWRRHRDKVGSLKDALEIQKAVTEVTKLKAVRNQLQTEKNVHRTARLKLSRQEEKIKKEAAKIIKDAKNLKPNELSKAFTDLGF